MTNSKLEEAFNQLKAEVLKSKTEWVEPLFIPNNAVDTYQWWTDDVIQFQIVYDETEEFPLISFVCWKITNEPGENNLYSLVVDQTEEDPCNYGTIHNYRKYLKVRKDFLSKKELTKDS